MLVSFEWQTACETRTKASAEDGCNGLQAHSDSAMHSTHEWGQQCTVASLIKDHLLRD